MTLTAFHDSNPEDSKSGFATCEEAHEYIKGFCCKHCLEDAEKGYADVTYCGSNEKERIEFDSVMDTLCGANWSIITDEEFEDLKR